MTDQDRTAPPALAPGFFGNARYDAISGFLVFLIAMPLCLAIAKASNFPPIAGIWTAVLGGVICSLLSNSQLTIKGPAAGLIVIVASAVTELGNHFGEGLSEADKAMLGYRLALGIGVVSGIIQIIFGLVRAGRLADFFPLTPVHGMLASIGLIIIAKQAYAVLGATPEKNAEPLKLLMNLPAAIKTLNPEIAVIGLTSLAILFGMPFVPIKWLKKVPAQLVVLIVAMALGAYFDLEHEHTYLFPNSFFESGEAGQYNVGPRFLVDMPEVLHDPKSAFFFPDFRGVFSLVGLKALVLFCLIGSLESLLSAKAIELLDPWRRKTNFDRDLASVGVANTIAASIGGLPMISEIVRSSANINNGGRSRAANLFHGLFLLAFVLLLPNLIHRIPLSALGAMLVYTGFRLAAPREFFRAYKVGSEQFIVFVGTIIATLATDLLIGIAVGMAIKVAFHLWNGAPFSSFWKANYTLVEEGDELAIMKVEKAAIFSNWMGLKRAIMKAAENRKEVVIDLSDVRLVDHSVMEKLEELAHDFEANGKELRLLGLDTMVPLSRHHLSARRRKGTAGGR